MKTTKEKRAELRADLDTWSRSDQCALLDDLDACGDHDDALLRAVDEQMLKDRQQMAWTAAYGATFAGLAHNEARTFGWDVLLSEKSDFAKAHSVACRVADAAVKGLK